MWYIVASIGGIAVGFILSRIVSIKDQIGYLVVDTSDPADGPFTFLQSPVPVSEVMKKKYVTLKVKVTNLISPK